jgi:hypothetical protein
VEEERERQGQLAPINKKKKGSKRSNDLLQREGLLTRHICLRKQLTLN